MSDGALYTAMTAMVAQMTACEPFAARCLLSNTDPSDPDKHIHLYQALVAEGNDAYSNSMNDRRPFVVIQEQGDGFQQATQGTSVGTLSGGQLLVLFSDVARETDTPTTSMLDFVRWVSSVIRWFQDNNGTGAYLTPWPTAEIVGNYERTVFADQEQPEQDFWVVSYAFSYGVPNA